MNEVFETFDTNFLIGFRQLCLGTEIPEQFAMWSGIAGISCALGRQCWIDMGTYTIYPNLYTVLVGASGRVRKSTSIGVIEKLLRQVEEPKLNLIAQKITPEALIDAMRQVETSDPTRIGGLNQSVGFVIADELSTFLNRQSYEAGLGSILIPMFDCKDTFEYHTKGGGRQQLAEVSLGMLAASTVDWLINAIPENAVGGGLTSRVIFVYVKKPAPPVAITTFDDFKRDLHAKLLSILKKVHTIRGQFTLEPSAWSYYVAEYNKWNTKTGVKYYENKNLSGYASRRHMHGLKIAMILSASESTRRVVTETHVKSAYTFLEQTEIEMPLVLELVTSSQQGAILAQVLDMIRTRKTCTKAEVIRAFSSRITSRELDVLIETLMQAGQISQLVQGDKIFFKPADE